MDTTQPIQIIHIKDSPGPPSGAVGAFSVQDRRVTMHVTKSIAVALGALVLASGNAYAAQSIRMIITGFAPISLNSFSTSVTNLSTSPNKPVCGQVILTKNIDDVDVAFIREVFTGTVTPKMLIEVIETNKGQSTVIYTLELDAVRVQEVAQTDSTSAANLTETITLLATQYKFQFNIPSEGKSPTFGFNCQTQSAG
jgi:type VI protein secretion system component Hcp